MINLRSLPLVLALAIYFVAVGLTPASGQIPPRFYWKSLIGGNAVPVIGMFLSGNANPLDPGHTVLDGSFEANVALVGYARTFPLFDRAAHVAVLAPMGRISGEATVFVRLPGETTVFSRTFTDDASGFGDPLFEFDLNLIGPKVIRNIPDLARYEPGFSLDVLADLIIPIGEYNNEQPLNLGQNRWYGRIGAPIVWQLGPWIPGRRTTLEFIPSLWLYGDNDDFVGRKLSTEPMFQLESHFTRDFHPDLWGSFDVNWMTGGSATLDDGVPGDALNSLTLGLTLGYHINDNLQLTAGYMATVNDNEPTDLRLDGFIVSLTFGWHPLIEQMKRLQGGP